MHPCNDCGRPMTTRRKVCWRCRDKRKRRHAGRAARPRDTSEAAERRRERDRIRHQDPAVRERKRLRNTRPDVLEKERRRDKDRYPVWYARRVAKG